MAITFILNRCRSGWQIFQEDLITSSDLEKMGPSQRSDGLSTAVTNTLFVSVHPSPTTCALAPAPRAARTSAPSAPAASQTRTAPSRPPDTSSLESEPQARLVMVSVCPRSSRNTRPSARSHTLILRSSPPEASNLPSGEQARVLTPPL